MTRSRECRSATWFTVWEGQVKRNSVASTLKTFKIGMSNTATLCAQSLQNADELARYWGVFWINGQSVDKLKETLISNVAKKGEVGDNHEAALHWLSKQTDSWLLIIDNADDVEIDLKKFVPKGANGHVLVTTRNQDCAFSNVGSRHFSGMQEDEAKQLFLKCTNVTESDENRSIVSMILRELGYLALAVVMAGTAIKQGVVKLADYLKQFESSWTSRRSGGKGSNRHKNSDYQRFVVFPRSSYCTSVQSS